MHIVIAGTVCTGAGAPEPIGKGRAAALRQCLMFLLKNYSFGFLLLARSLGSGAYKSIEFWWLCTWKV